LPKARVARREDLIDARFVIRSGPDVAARVVSHAQIVKQTVVFDVHISHRQQDEISGDRELAARDFFERPAARGVRLAPFDAHGVEFFDASIAPAQGFGQDGSNRAGPAFFMGG
jgi:hypothetical protein